MVISSMVRSLPPNLRRGNLSHIDRSSNGGETQGEAAEDAGRHQIGGRQGTAEGTGHQQGGGGHRKVAPPEDMGGFTEARVPTMRPPTMELGSNPCSQH